MKMKLWLLLPVALLATACQAAGQATGMGWIPSSVDATEKATFGFLYDGTTQTFSGSFHDRAAGVDLKGTGVLKAGPPPTGMKSKGGCLAGEPMYESQNRDHPGHGRLTLIVCDADGSGGATDEDFIFIAVTSGPYGPPFLLIGYQNAGPPNGNITCKGECFPP